MTTDSKPAQPSTARPTEPKPPKPRRGYLRMDKRAFDARVCANGAKAA